MTRPLIRVRWPVARIGAEETAASWQFSRNFCQPERCSLSIASLIGTTISRLVFQPFLADAYRFDDTPPARFHAGINLTGAQFDPAAARSQASVFENSPVVMGELFAKMGANQFRIVGVNEERWMRIVGMQGSNRFANDRQDEFWLQLQALAYDLVGNYLFAC